MEDNRIQLLVDGSAAAYILDEWWNRGYDFDMTVRRVKGKHKVIIEVTDTLYASKPTQELTSLNLGGTR